MRAVAVAVVMVMLMVVDRMKGIYLCSGEVEVEVEVVD